MGAKAKSSRWPDAYRVEEDEKSSYILGRNGSRSKSILARVFLRVFRWTIIISCMAFVLRGWYMSCERKKYTYFTNILLALNILSR